MESNAAILCKSYCTAGSSAAPEKDLFQELHHLGYLDLLLTDRTTHNNIIWATDTYCNLGKEFGRMERIMPDLIIGRHDHLSSIRKERRIDRTHKHGEVTTPPVRMQ